MPNTTIFRRCIHFAAFSGRIGLCYACSLIDFIHCEGPYMNTKNSFALLILALTLTGCTSTNQTGDHAHSHKAIHGDLQETTASADILPAFLDGQSNLIRNAYLVAGFSTELLKWIPCYCGCGESAGHESNLNCFVQEVKEDGSIVWDDHGTRCGVCIEIAVQSVIMSKESKSLQQIRQTIDEKYKDGYGAPTPTPYPL